MSLLSSFISTQLIRALENEFVHHLPDIQATIIHEIQAFIDECAKWVENKLEEKIHSEEHKS